MKTTVEIPKSTHFSEEVETKSSETSLINWNITEDGPLLIRGSTHQELRNGNSRNEIPFKSKIFKIGLW